MSDSKIFPAFLTNDVPVMLSSSNLFAPYTGVFIKSLIDCSSADHNYDIVIFEREISAQNKYLLQQLREDKSNISIRFFNPSAFLSSFGISALYDPRLPVEVCCKLLTPFIMEGFEKIIAVDSDTLLKRDIAELAETNLQDFCVGGIQDIPWEGAFRSNYFYNKEFGYAKDYCREVLTVKDPTKYINGGVLVFNCQQYREEINIETILNVAQSKRFLAADQDVVNLVFEGKIKFLDPAWNTLMPINPYNNFVTISASEESKAAYNRALQQPYLLHWAARPKPWVCPDVAFGFEWWQTAMKTPFVGHIIARMVDALATRREHYMTKYGQVVPAWDPIPDVDRSKKGIK